MAQGEFVCGDTVRDGNGNEYATVRIGALCWTKSNMRAVSYADGTPIAKAMIYNSERYNDTVSNLANFGRLYSWWSAVYVPEGGDAKPEKDTAGFVQGVCPDGWHIPTVEEMNDLRNNPEEDLHSTDFWVLPNANTNSTGFSELPGGKFSAELDCFEGLYEQLHVDRQRDLVGVGCCVQQPLLLRQGERRECTQGRRLEREGGGGLLRSCNIQC